MVAEVFIISITLLSLVYFLTLQILEKALDKVNIPADKETDSKKDTVTVIVCARNEQKNLPALFHCLESQDTGKILVEFIIVNDRSEDNTAQLIKDQCRRDERFKAIHINDRIAGFAPKKRAIDTAVKQASGQLLLLTDADGRPKKEWIRAMVRYFSDGADMVIGYAPYTADSNSKMINKIMALEYFSIAMIAASTTAMGYPVTSVGTNFAYRKKVYQQVGGFGRFKSYISGDDDLFLTIVREKRAYNIRYAAGAGSHVFNNPPKSISQFVNQRLRFASKGLDYPFKVTLGLSMYVLFNLLLILGTIAAVFQSQEILFSLSTVLLLKTLFEYKYVRKAARVISDSRFTNYYFVTAILHLPYVLFFGIFGQFKIFKWAENKAEHGVLKKAEQA